MSFLQSKTGQRSTSEFAEINIPHNSQLEFCLDTFVLTGSGLNTIEDLLCSDLMHVNYLINDNNCLVITSEFVENLETDLLCLRLCDEEEECFELILQINVRKPLPLPFIEDFSYPGPYPDPLKWMDRNVFINNTMALNPVSIGVATFDGLDAAGSPYGGFEADVADILTSAFFDLSSFTIQDNVYLSFWLQPRGLALRPRLEDVFILEFKNNQGEWIEIAEYPGILGATPPFSYKSILLTNAFLHSEFQFRFSNVNSRSGIREVWHLDYIRLDNNRDLSPHFEDIAFTHPPTPLIYPYTAMPMSQFANHEEKYLNDIVGIGLYNHFEETRTANPSWMLIREMYSGQHILNEGDLTLLEVPPLVPELQRDPSPGWHYFTNPMRSLNWIDILRNSTIGRDSALYRTTYTFRQEQEINNNIAETLRNNRVTLDTEINDYYAYDDGTCEIGIALISNPGTLTELAVKFYAEQADSLRAVQFHFPYINGDVSNLLFNIKVYIGELKEEADFTMIFQRPIHVDQLLDSLQAFTTYALIDDNTGERTSLIIPPGDFYVGWQQVSTGNRINIGYDRNNPQGLDYIYLKTDMGWGALAGAGGAIPGAVMLRPLFGTNTIPATSINEIKKQNTSLFDLFPNPTDGSIYLKSASALPLEKYTIHIYNTLGQLVQSTTFAEELSMYGQVPGFYHLIVRNEQNFLVSQHNFILK